MNKKRANIIAVLLLVFMITVAILSMRDESAIMDEVAHTPSGYSYLTQRDMRLNPEHPPLLKDLSAIPLLFIKDINFPDQIDSWQNKVNGQWDFGFNFLYNSDNDADKIIFWSRIPMLLILLILGLYIFRWAKELFGYKSGLFALFLFSFSPTFIAHGRYVTTDVGAAAAFFIATYYFVRWLINEGSPTSFRSRTSWNLIFAGVAFGLAQLIKFSLILLLPYFGILLLLWIFIGSKKVNFKRFWTYAWKFALILIIGYIVVYPVYYFHTSNYPVEKQVSDTAFLSAPFPEVVSSPLIWAAGNKVLRPYAQYSLGLFMVFGRATGGNTTYFLGDVTNKGWHHYFPTVYLIKTPLALHILTLFALLFPILFFFKRKKKKGTFSQFLKKYFPEIAMLIILAVYWASSITSNLNIGVRHVLPAFPFIYLLLAGQFHRFFSFIQKKGKKIQLGSYLILALLLAWYALSSLTAFPYYLSHFNELVGGNNNGYKYVTDSNLDWGQDLKRLAKWVDENEIEKIKIDYFGGGDMRYYLGDKYEPWHGDADPSGAKGSWLAVSATFLQQGRATATKGWPHSTTYYSWLNQYEPVTVIGGSLFVFYID